MHIQLTLIGKPGCHLCEDAQSVIDAVVAQFRGAHTGVAASVQVSLEHKNILADADLAKQYAEEIPVLLINGKVHNYWRIDPIRFRAALDNLVE